MFLLKLIVIKSMVTFYIVLTNGEQSRTKDIDTCEITNSTCCKPDMQKDGINSCGYVISIHQVVNYPKSNITIKPLESGDLQTINFVKKLEHNFLKFMSKELRSNVNNLVIKSIWKIKNKRKYKLTYDIYCTNNTLKPSDIAADFIDRKKFYRRERGQKRMFEEWHRPKPEPSDTCTQKVLAFQGQYFNFMENVKIGTRAKSKEQCPDAGSSKASVKCVSRNYTDGSSMAYYRYETISIASCKVQKPNTLSAWEKLLLRLAKSASDISANSTKQSTENPYGSSKKLLLELYKFLKNNKSLTMSSSAFKSVSTIVHSLSNDQNSQENSNDSDAYIDIAFAMETISTRIKLQPNETLVVENPLMFVTAKLVNSSDLFPIGDSLSNRNKTPTFVYEEMEIFLPDDAMHQIATSRGRDIFPVSFIAYKDDFLFRHLKQKTQRIGQVLSVNVADFKVENLSTPMSYRVPLTYKNNETDKKQLLYKCVYLDEYSKDWRADGCSLNSENDVPTCECNHLTNFAVLVKTNNLTDPYALEILGKVGCSISIFSLVLMLLTQFCLPALRKIETNKIHTHLGICLLITYLTFLVGVERVSHRGGCISIAAFLHFFLLSSWGWMTIECVTMYKKLVLVFSNIGKHYVLKCSIFVYLIAATIVIVNVVITVGWLDNAPEHNNDKWLPVNISDSGIQLKSFYISDRMCWLHDYSLVIGFLCPIGICFLINLAGFAMILKAITCGRVKNRAAKVLTKREELKTYLIRASIITLLLGLTWCFAIPLVMTDDKLTNVVFGWLFSVANSLQGFFIFFLLYVKRKDVRKMWMEKLRCSICFHVMKKSAKSTEGTSGSQDSPSKTKTITEQYDTDRV